MKLLQKSNVIGAIFLGVYALSFLFNRPMSLGKFDVGAMVMWFVIAWALMKRPRGFGLPVAFLTLGSVALQFHFLHTSLTDYTAETGITVRPKLWVKFWISVSPLILGGLFSAFSFWIPTFKNPKEHVPA